MAVPLSFENARAKAYEHAGLASLLENAEAAARARRAAAAALPNPSAFVEHETLDGDVGGMDETAAGLSTRLDFLWKRAARIESADRRNSIAAHRIDDERRRISYELATYFISIESVTDELEAVRTSHESLQRARQIAESLVSNGEIPQSNLRRIELALDQLELESVDLESRLAGNLAQLSALTAVEDARPAGRVQVEDLAFTSVSEAISTAYRQRPDLKAVEAFADWQDAEVARIRAEGRPDASLDLAYKRNSDDQSGAFIGLSVELPIFGVPRAEATMALSEKRDADLQIAQARRTVAGEVAAAFQRLQSLQRLGDLPSRDSTETSQNEAFLNSSAAAFEAGEASLLEYLDALRTHLDSTRSQLTFAQRLKLAVVELAHLTASDMPFTTTR